MVHPGGRRWAGAAAGGIRIHARAPRPIPRETTVWPSIHCPLLNGAHGRLATGGANHSRLRRMHNDGRFVGVDVAKTIPDRVTAWLGNVLGKVHRTVAHVSRWGGEREETSAEPPQAFRVRLDQRLAVDHEIINCHGHRGGIRGIPSQYFLRRRSPGSADRPSPPAAARHAAALLPRLSPIAVETERRHLAAVHSRRFVRFRRIPFHDLAEVGDRFLAA